MSEIVLMVGLRVYDVYCFKIQCHQGSSLHRSSGKCKMKIGTRLGVAVHDSAPSSFFIFHFAFGSQGTMTRRA
jgi:hypothetical protein